MTLVSIAVGVIAFLVLAGPARAQSAPPPDARRADLELRKMQADLERADLEQQKLQAEIGKAQLEKDKLQSEIEKLRGEIRQLGTTTFGALPWLQVLGVGSLLGGLLVLVAGVVAGRSLSHIQRRKLEQELEFGQADHALQQRKLEQEIAIARSAHDLKLFEALGAAEARLRVGAVSELGQRIRALPPLDPAAPARTTERETILKVLIAVTKHESDEDMQKHIADLIVDVLGARAKNLPESPLKHYDFQGAKLTNAWWKGVDARGADFYEACLARAGLSDSDFSGAALKHANLKGVTFRGASAEGANLEAANLSEARAADANFSRAMLGKANLTSANLAGANLSGADLAGADLSGADLSGASLDGANLTGAIVANATFSNASLARAKLNGVDLRSANLAGVDLTTIVSDRNTHLP